MFWAGVRKRASSLEITNEKNFYITFFSFAVALFYLFLSFVMGRMFYNIDNGIAFYQINLFSFFKNFNIKDVGFFFLIFSIFFFITYIRYKDY